MVHPRATYFALDTLRHMGVLQIPEVAKLAVSEDDMQKIVWGIDTLDYRLLREVVLGNKEWYRKHLEKIYSGFGGAKLNWLLHQIVEVGHFAEREWGEEAKSPTKWKNAWGLSASDSPAHTDKYTIRGMLAKLTAKDLNNANSGF